MTDEELTLLIRCITGSGFIIQAAHRADTGDDGYVITVKAPPARPLT